MVNYSVSARTHEIGVRRALGAQKSDVLRMVVFHMLRPVLADLLVGLAGAFAMTRILATKLYEITPHDSPTYAIVAFLLLSAALIACWAPARRATGIDPIVALRHE